MDIVLRSCNSLVQVLTIEVCGCLVDPWCLWQVVSILHGRGKQVEEWPRHPRANLQQVMGADLSCQLIYWLKVSIQENTHTPFQKNMICKINDEELMNGYTTIKPYFWNLKNYYSANTSLNKYEIHVCDQSEMFSSTLTHYLHLSSEFSDRKWLFLQAG